MVRRFREHDESFPRCVACIEQLEPRALFDALPSWVATGGAAQWNPLTHTLSVYGATQIIADPGSANAIVNAGQGAKLTLAPASGLAVHLAGLHLSGNAVATVAPFGIGRTASNHRVLVVKGGSSALTIGADSTLDIADNGLMFDYVSLLDDPSVAVESLVRRGFNGGGWNGTGITSSVASWNANFALGVGDNLGLVLGFGDGNTAIATFAGEPVDLTSVLVKFTYRTDLDLDGAVSSNDAAIFNSYYSDIGSNRWTTGDVDYDGSFTSNDDTVFTALFDETPKSYYAVGDATDFVSGSSGSRMFGSATFGSNGCSVLDPELFAGNGSQLGNGRRTWDDDLFDGLDSGSVELNFDANLSSGSSNLSAGGSGSTAASVTGVTGGHVGGVAIKVDSLTGGSASWDDLTIYFYTNGSLAETLNISASLSANGAASPTGIQERRLVVTPGSSDYDRVEVSGTFRLQCGADTVPAPADLFGEILVFPSAQ